MDQKYRSFTAAERARIRYALRAYMASKGIGTPSLCGEIGDTDKLKRTVPLSTLQRFLKGSHETFDTYVEIFAAFVDRLADAKAQDAIDEFGGALSSFYTLRWPKEGSAVPDDYCGRYDAFYRAAETSVVAGRNREHEAVSYASLSLERSESGAFLRVKERVIGGEGTASLDDLDPDVLAYLYEGVLLPLGAVLRVFLRNVLTHAVRAYDVAPTQDGILDGVCLDPSTWMPTGSEPVIPQFLECRLCRITDQEPKTPGETMASSQRLA